MKRCSCKAVARGRVREGDVPPAMLSVRPKITPKECCHTIPLHYHGNMPIYGCMCMGVALHGHVIMAMEVITPVYYFLGGEVELFGEEASPELPP
jgi:hypothetical protein